MTLSERVERLENAFAQVASIQQNQATALADLNTTLGQHTTLLQEHRQLLRDIIVLLGDQGERLERIERAIRERGQNGQP